MSIKTSVVQHELNPIWHKEQQTIKSFLNYDKNPTRKNVTTKQRKAFKQVEKDHRHRFQENTSLISETPISTNQTTISLTQPNPWIDHSPFSHLQCEALTQTISATQIQHNLFSIPLQNIQSPMMIPLQSLVFQQQKWNSIISAFQRRLVLMPYSVKKWYGYTLSCTDCYRNYPKNIIIRYRD